jgi:hypothetical protein
MQPVENQQASTRPALSTNERRRRRARPIRARYPDQEGFVERGDVRIFYEVFGTGEPTVLLLPTWSIIHSRLWKAQVPYLARHCPVITFDGRGNGQSSRPESAYAYSDREFVAKNLRETRWTCYSLSCCA